VASIFDAGDGASGSGASSPLGPIKSTVGGSEPAIGKLEKANTTILTRRHDPGAVREGVVKYFFEIG